MDIKFVKREKLKEKPKGDLGFGVIFTDYVFNMDWDKDKGWHDAQIVPYEGVNMDPASMVLHYAQATFEGLKAYKGEDGKFYLFRPNMNAKRFINSNKRLCLPELPEDMFIEAIKALVKVEKDWIPTGEGESLYIRPFMYAKEVKLGVAPSKSYRFSIILSPVGAYYKEGLAPVKIYVEDELTRASLGGTGFAKCAGNYAASLLGQVKAEKLGYTQVLWLDGVHRKYVEEVGSMNAMFLIDDTVITAPAGETVLPGVTRDSVIHILKDMGYKVSEEHLAVEDLMKAAKDGRLKEAWGTGTAAVISPIGELFYKGEEEVINNFETGDLTHEIYKRLTDIQWARSEDKFGWREEIKMDWVLN